MRVKKIRQWKEEFTVSPVWRGFGRDPLTDEGEIQGGRLPDLFEGPNEAPGDPGVGFRDSVFGLGGDDGLSRVSAFANKGVERDPAEEWHAEFRGTLLPAPG